MVLVLRILGARLPSGSDIRKRRMHGTAFIMRSKLANLIGSLVKNAEMKNPKRTILIIANR